MTVILCRSNNVLSVVLKLPEACSLISERFVAIHIQHWSLESKSNIPYVLQALTCIICVWMRASLFEVIVSCRDINPNDAGPVNSWVFFHKGHNGPAAVLVRNGTRPVISRPLQVVINRPLQLVWVHLLPRRQRQPPLPMLPPYKAPVISSWMMKVSGDNSGNAF